jgi:hypothetical protein
MDDVIAETMTGCILGNESEVNVIRTVGKNDAENIGTDDAFTFCCSAVRAWLTPTPAEYASGLVLDGRKANNRGRGHTETGRG